MQSGTVSNGYRFVRMLGRGSRAAVWEAVHVVTSRRVAVKILDTMDPGERQRLVTEYQAMSTLTHPNIIGVHALLELEGMLALVLQLVEGPDLTDYLAQTPPNRHAAMAIFAGILRGLAAAHAKGMVHRDLKPGNILIAEGPLPRIGDFGIVKVGSDHDITNSGMILGTFRYMAPEQLRDARSVDARADLFSAGCILFELLTHTQAFDGPNKIALMNAVRKKEHRPIPDDVDPAVAQVLSELLEPDPDDRPPSAVAVLERLGLALEEDTVVPHAAMEAGSRVGLYLAIAVVLVLTIAVGSWVVYKATTS